MNECYVVLEVTGVLEGIYEVMVDAEAPECQRLTDLINHTLEDTPGNVKINEELNSN